MQQQLVTSAQSCFISILDQINVLPFFREKGDAAISKRANCDSQKVIEDILNVTTDIETIASVNNWVNNSVTDLANCIINFFWNNDMLYE